MPDTAIIQIETTCPVCGRTDHIPVRHGAYVLWHECGKLIQDAMPELSATQREQLITGICGPCWEHMWLCPHCGADEMTDHPDGQSGLCDACGKRS
jgi:hypothetical protein